MATNPYIEQMGSDANEYEMIVALTPAHGTLRQVVAYEIARLFQSEMRVYDLGCGLGDSSLPIAHMIPGVDLRPVDEDANMIRTVVLALHKIPPYGAVRSYTCDIAAFLAELLPEERENLARDNPVLLTSSWVIHNFEQSVRLALLRAIAHALEPGEAFVLMDKIYPSIGQAGQRDMFEVQLGRYRNHLPHDVATKIIAHEEHDFSIRMEENSVLQLLWSLDFEVRIADRVERDVVLVCTKC